jgi:hypothetical protein
VSLPASLSNGIRDSSRRSTVAAGIYLLIIFAVALVVLDLAALRFGADSRSHDDRPNWW